MVRVWSLSFLLRLRTDSEAHCAFARRLVRTLVSKERDLLLVTSYKQFSNSLSHRQKHRVFTALLVLHEFMPDVSNRDIIKSIFFQFILVHADARSDARLPVRSAAAREPALRARSVRVATLTPHACATFHLGFSLVTPAVGQCSNDMLIIFLLKNIKIVS